MPSTVFAVFKACAEAMEAKKLIHRESRKDKEFHFQNWFGSRLEELGIAHEAGGRNSYPDYRIVSPADGYEVKGLAYPGRDASFDSNSQVPTGHHNDRSIYYVFGRYPKEPDGDDYPVLDLVLCHGDFLNPDRDYVHKNKSVRGFGTYGDILIRDRKMYVVPTPFHLVANSAHHVTLILPKDQLASYEFVAVGDLVREEAARLVVAYGFDLRTNDLRVETIVNPNAGLAHRFRAWRLAGRPGPTVLMLKVSAEDIEVPEPEDDCNS